MLDQSQSRALRLEAARKLRLRHLAACQRDYATFFRAAWKILEPNTPLKDNWDLDLISEYLMACKLRQITRLIINKPPREAKSSQITVCFPPWVWIHEPHERFMFYSFAQSLATKHSRDRRTLIESPWYQAAWGKKYTLATDQNTVTEFSNDKRGHMIANSMDGGTGKGGNWGIVDDPVDPKRAHSEPLRERANTEFDRTVQQRLDDPSKSVLIITQQRTHEKDLTGHALATDRSRWTYLRLPAEAPKSVYIRFPLSGRKYLRKQGEPLNAKQKSKEQLKAIHRAIGSYNYSGQFQQAPSPPGGVIFKRAWWKYWSVLPRLDRHIIVMDAAFKGLDSSSPVCIQYWGAKGSDRYLVDQVHDRMDFIASVRALEEFVASHPADGIWVEDKANGPAIMTTLKSKIAGLLPFPGKAADDSRLSVIGNASKVERARAVSPQVQAGNVWLPEDVNLYPWVGGVVNEAALFPNGELKDRVDCISMALLILNETASGSFTRDAIPDGEGSLMPSMTSGDQW